MASSSAAARANWRIVRRALGDPEPLSLTDTTPAERIAMMWELALSSWLLAGRSLPSYARGEAPIRSRRLGDTATPDGTD